MKNNLMRIILVLCLCVVVFSAFDKDKPASSTSLRSSNPEILANWSALETAISNEHEFSTGGTNSGDHTQGSARSFSQATAPATQVDGGSFASTDLGSLWVDTDDNAFYMLTATTPTWTPVSTEVIATLLASNRIFAGTLKSTGDFTVGANKVVVTAASGNTTIAGTLGVTGVATLGDTSALATSGAPAADAQIANKKYVDDQIASEAIDPDPMTGSDDSIGTITFPNGFIMKWGKASRTGTDTTLTFATAFPTACFQVIACGGATNATAAVFSTHTITKTGCVLRASANSPTIRWFAIGR